MISSLTVLGVFAFSVLGLSNASRADFESVVEKNDFALIAFVSPSTEVNGLVEVEQALITGPSNCPLITVDCAIETEFCSEQDVASVPAIRLFKGRDIVHRYRGQKTASEIVSFVNRATRPVLSSLTSTNISSFKSIDKHVFVAYLDGKDTDGRSIFQKLAARNLHRFSFGIATEARLAKAESVQVPSIVVYKTSEGVQETYTGEWRLKTLETFVETATKPLIGELTRRNEVQYLQAGKSLVYIFAETSGERSHYQTLLRPLAEKYNEYINFVTIDAVEYVQMAPGLGIVTKSFPAVALQNPSFGQVFPYKSGKEILVEGLNEWILGIVGGNVQPWSGHSDGKSNSGGRDEL